MAPPQPLEAIPIGANRQFQFGQLANWQFNPIQSAQFNEDIQLVGLAKEAEIDAEVIMWPASDDCLRQARCNM